MDTAHVSCSGKMACSFRLSFYKVWISVQRFEGNHTVANASKYSLMSLICSSTASISNAEVDASIFFREKLKRTYPTQDIQTNKQTKTKTKIVQVGDGGSGWFLSRLLLFLFYTYIYQFIWNLYIQAYYNFCDVM